MRAAPPPQAGAELAEPARAGQLADRPPADEPHEPPVSGKADDGRHDRADEQAGGEERDPTPCRSRNRVPRRLSEDNADKCARRPSERLRHDVQQNAQGQLDAPEPRGVLVPVRRLDRRRNKMVEEAGAPYTGWY